MTAAPRRQWPAEGIARVPYWAYSDPEIYAREQARIFCGPSWSYVALEAEIPNAGDWKRTFIGDLGPKEAGERVTPPGGWQDPTVSSHADRSPR